MTHPFVWRNPRAGAPQRQNAASSPLDAEDIHETPTLTQSAEVSGEYVKPPLVIVVQEDAASRARIADRLADAGCRVLVASRADEAMWLAHTGCPALVIVDLTAARLRSSELPRALRADPATRLVPILALTASAERDPMAEFPICDAAIAKDADAETLLRALRAVVPSPIGRAPDAP